MANDMWFIDAPKSGGSGGYIEFAHADGVVENTSRANYTYLTGFKCVKEAGFPRDLFHDDYEAYSYHAFIKFAIPTLMSAVVSAKLYLHLYHEAFTNVAPDPTIYHLGVWYKKDYDGNFPWSISLVDADYSYNTWEYLTSSSENIYSLIGQASYAENWITPIDVTEAVNYAISQAWSWVAFRFMFSYFGLLFDAPVDWNYDERPVPYNQECWLRIRGAGSITPVNIPNDFPADKFPTGQCQSCPWLTIEVPSGEIPPQNTPGELGGPCIINCVDADVKAATAVAGTSSGGLWITWSGGVWYKAYEHTAPITAVYMDYVKNFVDYPDDEIAWFGTSLGEVFKSTDSVHTWNASNTFTGSVHDIEGNDLDSNKVAVSVGNSIYTTTNGGETWIQSKEDLSHDALGLMVRGDEIQAIFSDGIGYRSPNFGTTWHNLTGITNTSADVGFDYANEQNSFVGTSGKLYVFDDGSTDFIYVSGAAIGGATNQIDVSYRASIGIIGTSEKIYKTPDFGHTVYELYPNPAQSVAMGGLIPVPWVTMPCNKPDNCFNYPYEPTYFTPYKNSLIRSTNGDLYLIIQGVTECMGCQLTGGIILKRSIDGGHTWTNVSFTDVRTYDPPSFTSDYSCGGGGSGPPLPVPGGAQVLVDNAGNIHLFGGVYWRKKVCTTSVYFTYRDSLTHIDHIVLKPNSEGVIEEISKEHLWIGSSGGAGNTYTDVYIYKSAINSRGEHVTWFKERDYGIPYELTYQTVHCDYCGWVYDYRNGDPSRGIPAYASYYEAVAAGRLPAGGGCPICGSPLTITHIWPAIRVNRNGDVVWLTGSAIGYASRILWENDYPGTNIMHLSGNLGWNMSLQIDSYDGVHITYYDPYTAKTIYQYQPYGSFEITESELDWGAYGTSFGIIGSNSPTFDSLIDQYDNIHYFLGTNYYVIKLANGTWSSKEVMPLGITSPSSYSRNWNGTIWQLVHNGSTALAYKRIPLSAPITDQSLMSFLISSPELTLTNSNFESNPALTGWTQETGTGSKSSVQAYQGTYSMRLVGTVASYYQNNNWVMPERTIVASTWVWCTFANRAKISLGDYITPVAAIPASTKLVAVGDNSHNQCNITSWTDIIQIEAGGEFTAGLKSNGTAVAIGSPGGQMSIQPIGWTDITKVSAGWQHLVGLKSDGTVVGVGRFMEDQLNVEDWESITQVSAGGGHTLGLKSDGTVIAVGTNEDGQCDVGGWTNIIQVCAGQVHSIGVKSNGTVVSTGYNSDGQCNVGGWTNIVQVDTCHMHTVGLKSDGTVVAVGLNSEGQCNVGSWRNIIQIAAGYRHTVGLKSDGTVVAVGANGSGQCDVNDWGGITQVSAGGPATGEELSGHTVGVYAFAGTPAYGGWEYTNSSYHTGTDDGCGNYWHLLMATRIIRAGANQVIVKCQIDSGSNTEAFFDVVTVRCVNPFYELTKGNKIQVINSIENNGTYTVARTPTYYSEDETTLIEVAERLPSVTVSGAYGDIITVDMLSASGYTCGIWEYYKSQTVGTWFAGNFPNTPCTLYDTHPIDENGNYASIFEDGFAVAGRIQPNWGTEGRLIWYWSDPPSDVPETKLLEGPK